MEFAATQGCKSAVIKDTRSCYSDVSGCMIIHAVAAATMEKQLEVGTTTDTRNRSTSIRLESGNALAGLASNTRQRYSTALLFGSTRQRFRLPAALQTPPTQQLAHGGSDIVKAKNRKHKSSLPHVPQTSQCTFESSRKYSQDHVPFQALPAESASGAGPSGTRKRHARMGGTCKP